jgi:hypothetical protein
LDPIRRLDGFGFEFLNSYRIVGALSSLLSTGFLIYGFYGIRNSNERAKQCK